MAHARRDDLPRMAFLQHLEALRSLLITSVIVVVVGTAAAWAVAPRLLDLVTRLLPAGSPAHVFAPTEAFFIRLKVSAAAGLFVGAPIILWRLWRFVAPALYRHERLQLRLVLLSSALLFYAGTAFGYLIIVPLSLDYFFGLVTPDMQMTLGITELFSLVARMSVAFGIAFQLPIVIFLLSLLGLVSPRWLLAQWQMAIVVILILSAVLTPGGDMVGQSLMAAPLLLLYLISCVLALAVARRKRAPGAGGSVDTPDSL
jgi:sec-independent protein translocase protein TatC